SLEGGIDDIRRHADGGPAVALPVPALDQNPRHGVGAGGEDTHLVVDELEIVDVALIAAEILAQRPVRRVHWTVALAHRKHGLAVDAHLHRRLRHRDELADGIVPALDHDAERLYVEELRHIAQYAARKQLEGSIRRLISIAVGLALLHLFEQ